uniref:Uncharacterized protein n=1 Tax=Heterorhabditis bacteriophora TaxID=37862 RepID=A0A1I7X921_HETBA
MYNNMIDQNYYKFLSLARSSRSLMYINYKRKSTLFINIFY